MQVSKSSINLFLCSRAPLLLANMWALLLVNKLWVLITIEILKWAGQGMKPYCNCASAVILHTVDNERWKRTIRTGNHHKLFQSLATSPCDSLICVRVYSMRKEEEDQYQSQIYSVHPHCPHWHHYSYCDRDDDCCFDGNRRLLE